MKWLLLVLIGVTLWGHDLHHTTTHQEAVVVAFTFAQEDDFSFQSFELYAPEKSDIPFAVGRTDAKGRAVFLPDVPGHWTLKVFSEDGHGAVVDVEVSEALAIRTEGVSQQCSLGSRLALGLGALFAIFALLYFIAKRRKNEAL